MVRASRATALAVIAALAACGPGNARTREVAGESANALTHLLSLADSQYKRTQYDSAQGSLEEEIRQAGQLGDSADIARGWTTLSIVHRRQGRFDEAQSYGERSVALKRRLGLNAELARSLNALGMVAYERGQYDVAVRIFHETRDAADAVRDSTYVARASGNMGLAYANMGDVDRARTEFLAFRAYSSTTGNVRDEGDALDNLGLLETRVGDPTAAIAWLTSARARYAKIDFDVGEENALGQLGVAWGELGETSRELAYLDSALSIARKDTLRGAETDDLALIAEAEESVGDHKGALLALGRAQALSESLQMTARLGHVLFTEAQVYASTGMPRLALSLANDAARRQQMADSPIAELTARLEAAEIAQRLGDARQSDSALARARNLADNLGSGIARIQFALGAARVGDAAKRSDEVLSQVGRMARDSALLTPEESSEKDALRARAFFRKGDFAGAAESGRRAVAAMERLRANLVSPVLGTAYVADRGQTYADLVVALLALKRVDSAFRIADAARGRALIDRLNAAQHDLPRIGATGDLAAADSLLRRINSLIERLRIADTSAHAARRERSLGPEAGEVERALAATRASYDSLLERMTRSDSRSAIVGAHTVDVGAVKRSLASDERLLEYFVTADRLLIFVVSRDSVAYAVVGITSNSLAAQADLARDLIVRRNEASSPLSALYESLIAPVDRRGLLTGARRLVIVPHGPLAYLPFPALLESEGGPYLVERFSISYLTSASALVPLRDRAGHESANGSRVFAPLTGQLPGSRKEASVVASELGVSPILDSNASESALREALHSAAIVHVASHGTLDVERPMFSSIALAPPPANSIPVNDGRLETHEVLSMDVHSRLVYLSGCETALGASQATSSRRNEDYATLAQAFLFAGANNVVATLWRIDDEGAAQFAGRFYHALRSDAAPDALAQAQREFIHGKTFGAPYYWAAYTVSGSGTK